MCDLNEKWLREERQKNIALKKDLIQITKDLCQTQKGSNGFTQFESGVVNGKLIAANYILEVLEKF